MEDLILEKVHEDKRGKIYEVKFGEKVLTLATYIKGALRGGHFHPHDKIHIVLLGRFDYWELNPENKKEKKMELKAGDSVNIKAFSPHLFVALEEGITLEPEGTGQAVNYPPWRKLVEDYLKS